MDISERTVRDVTVMDLQGRLTIDGGADQLRERLRATVAAGRQKILLNLANVPYIDSGGLGELVRCSLVAGREGGAVKLVNLTKRITDLLTITKLITVFETFDSEAAAVDSFK
jgi:anti-sigma B factor antagonist